MDAIPAVLGAITIIVMIMAWTRGSYEKEGTSYLISGLGFAVFTAGLLIFSHTLLAVAAFPYNLVFLLHVVVWFTFSLLHALRGATIGSRYGRAALKEGEYTGDASEYTQGIKITLQCIEATQERPKYIKSLNIIEGKSKYIKNFHP